MPRSRGGRPAARPMGRSSSPPSRGYSTSTSSSPKPAATPTAPARTQSTLPAQSSGGGGMMGGLMGTVAQGMAFGGGSAIAHRGIDAAFGAMSGSGGQPPAPADVQAGAQQLQEAQHPCAQTAQAFADCMSRSDGDMTACHFLYDAMQQCKLANPA